jgi:hypothetical protein
MSDPAAPWWAEVQHLRPREDRAEVPTSEPRRPGRFDREAAAARQDAAVATIEHELPDPWADEPAWGPEQHGWESERTEDPWAETLGLDAAPATEAPREDRETALWDDGLEEAFASTPSWTDDEHDQWLMPKGADRIENGRRTIEIRGQVDRVHGVTAPAETNAATRTGRRPARRASERFERRPDRVAMWAFFLGLLMIVVAAFSQPGEADAATHAAAVSQAPAAQVVVIAPAATPAP